MKVMAVVVAALLVVGLVYINSGAVRAAWASSALARGGVSVQVRVLGPAQAPGVRGIGVQPGVEYAVPAALGGGAAMLSLDEEQQRSALAGGQLTLRYLPGQPSVRALDGAPFPLGFLLTVGGIDLFLLWLAALLLWPARRNGARRAAGP